MRFGDAGHSDNVESRSAAAASASAAAAAAACGGMLFGLVASRFGIGGVRRALLVMFAASAAIRSACGGGQQAVAPQPGAGRRRARPDLRVRPGDRSFSCQVLGSTEDHWARAVRRRRASAISRRGWSSTTATDQSGCGAAQSAMGPFYCPADQRIYLDTDLLPRARPALPARPAISPRPM